MNDDKVVVYTDGGCDPNPGWGGWAAVLTYKGRRKELSGGEPDTTNNRMELLAAIRALESLRRRCKVELYTDSKYLQQGVTLWMPAWKARGWVRKGGEVKNLDLWKKLDEIVQTHDVAWRWVRGHAGNAMNERCDVLANEARDKSRASSRGDGGR